MNPLPQARGSDANGCLKGLFLLLGDLGSPSIHALWECLPFAHIFGGRRNPWKRPRLIRCSRKLRMRMGSFPS
jgi:hypothetical protein